MGYALCLRGILLVGTYGLERLCLGIQIIFKRFMLFIYGSHDLKLTANVTIKSKLSDGALHVDQLWADDPDQIASEYSLWCKKSN